MKITTAWVQPENAGELPWMASAYDEVAFDEHGGEPQWFKDEIAVCDGEVRHVIITISDDVLATLFEPATTDGSAAVQS